MKCGFKNNPDQPKMSPTKLNLGNVKLENSPVKYEQDSCKECKKIQGNHSPDNSFNALTPRKNDITEERPKHNKENLLKRLGEVEAQDECSELQDSGYSSILHIDSPCQDEDDSILSSAPVSETPKPLSSHNQRSFQSSSTNLLPVLHFEKVVCSTLKKSTKRSPKVNWDTVDEVIARGSFGLENLIGKHMGLERIDILGELFQKDFKHLLTKILRHLSAKDLINVIRVSTTWKKILEKDRWAYHTYCVAWKEHCEKEAKLSAEAATREVSLFRVPLSSVQKVASACCLSKKKTNKQNKTGSSSHSRHSDFKAVVKTLKNDQSLKVCRDCRSPAKYDSFLNRAVCTRDSCKLDFCTLCLCDYHFSKSCMTTKPPGQRFVPEPIPGSKKSKHNLRRL
ncbi:F-box only protein 5 [Discoglossus pictus]